MLTFAEFIHEGIIFNRKKKPINNTNDSLERLHNIIMSPEANDRSAWDLMTGVEPKKKTPLSTRAKILSKTLDGTRK